jgi:hypothetical protein
MAPVYNVQISKIIKGKPDIFERQLGSFINVCTEQAHYKDGSANVEGETR